MRRTDSCGAAGVQWWLAVRQPRQPDGRWAAGKGFAFLPAPREAVLISLGWSLGIAALKLPQRLPPAPTAGTRFLHLVIYSSSVNRREAGGALYPERL